MILPSRPTSWEESWEKNLSTWIVSPRVSNPPMHSILRNQHPANKNFLVSYFLIVFLFFLIDRGIRAMTTMQRKFPLSFGRLETSLPSRLRQTETKGGGSDMGLEWGQ